MASHARVGPLRSSCGCAPDWSERRAQQVRRPGLRSTIGTSNAPDTLDYGGQLSALTYDHGATSPGLAPAAFAAKQLAMALRAAGVQAQAAQRAGVAPHGARRLAAVPSPPLPVLIGLMNLRSD